LTRELTLLRQQTASVASTASSTSTGFNDPIEALHSSPYMSGSIHPTPSRRHRSSSNLSAYVPPAPGTRTGSVSNIAAPRESGMASSRPSGDFPRVNQSREPSATPSRQPVTTSPALSSAPHHGDSSHGSSNAAATRYEEAAHHRAEFESIKRENEMLRRRVRELEHVLKVYRDAQSNNNSTDPSGANSNLVNSMSNTSLGEGS
jgi:hypothetical protein